MEIRTGGIIDPNVINGRISLRIDAGPPGAVLLGDTEVDCPGGVAIFDNLIPSLEGGYSFEAVCDPASIIEPSPYVPGIDPKTPGIVGRYRGVPGQGLVDMLGAFPTLAYKGSSTVQYGLETPMGPLGVKAATGEFSNENATFPIDFPLAVCVLAFVHHPAIPGQDGMSVFSGYSLSNGQRSFAADAGLIAGGTPGTSRSRFGFWSGTRTNLSDSPPAASRAFSPGFQLIAIQARKEADNVGTHAYFLNGSRVSETVAFTGVTGHVWARANIFHLVTTLGITRGTTFVELAFLDRYLTLEEHAAFAADYGVAS